MRFQQAPYRIADVVALLFILHGNTSFGSLAPIIPYRSCKHYLEELTKTIAERNGTTPEAVRREMEAPRNSAWDTDDSSARGRQKVLFPAGKPQLSEFLEIIAKEIKKA